MRIADAQLEIDHLAGQRRQDPSGAVFVELHLARAAELAPRRFERDLLRLDVRKHGRIELDVVGKLRLRGRARGIARHRRSRSFASGLSLASRDRQARSAHVEQNQCQSHGITSSPTTDVRRLTARR